MKSKPAPRLIVAASEADADLLFATRFFAPDPFIFLEKSGHSLVVLNDLEIDRGRRQAQVDEVLAYSDLTRRCPSGKDASFAEHLATLLRWKRCARVQVPRQFPLGLTRDLEAAGVHIDPVAGSFFPERETKTAGEVKLLRRALKITEAGLTRGIAVLRESRIGKKDVLFWQGSPLTSERLRAEIDCAILQAGGLPANTIVAGGEQACDPHERGSGSLRAHSLIILDLFPRDARSGYFGDLTRTVVRGRANARQRALWETCLAGQTRALAQMKPGVEGRLVQEEVKEIFTASGYPTEQRNGRWTGFFHGLGHGLGLEIHEAPRISTTTFRPGQVITVEPGIYVPGIGGVRHEDVIVITERGLKVLSHFPKELEI